VALSQSPVLTLTAAMAAPRGAWPGSARLWRNRHQRCGTEVDLEMAGNFSPAGAESSLDLSWGIFVPEMEVWELKHLRLSATT
jgi:hypothetical protein